MVWHTIRNRKEISKTANEAVNTALENQSEIQLLQMTTDYVALRLEELPEKEGGGGMDAFIINRTMNLSASSGFRVGS